MFVIDHFYLLKYNFPIVHSITLNINCIFDTQNMSPKDKIYRCSFNIELLKSEI